VSASRFFVGLPWPFLDAWLAKEVDDLDVLIALYLGRRCFEARNTSGGIALVELSTLAELFDVSRETIRRRLQRLRERGWVDFQAVGGSSPTWRIWLTGLSIEEPDQGGSTLAPQNEPPDLWSYSSTDKPEPTEAIPQPESDSAPPLLHNPDFSGLDRRYETRREENQPAVLSTSNESAGGKESYEDREAFFAEMRKGHPGLFKSKGGNEGAKT
jgi:hypothetical protein